MFFFFFKQKTAYEMRISDWSSDVCSSDLNPAAVAAAALCVRCAAVAATRAHTTAIADAWRRFISVAGRDLAARSAGEHRAAADRKSVVEGKRVSVRVDRAGLRTMKKNKKEKKRHGTFYYQGVK